MRIRAIVVALLLALACVPGAAGAQVRPQVVVALIDTGINPYSPAFRDDSPLAQQHPSTYIPGYPAPPENDTGRLDITLDAATYDDAIAADADLWNDPIAVRRNKLYWFPGTRIVGAISLGDGGTSCPAVADHPPLNLANAPCKDRKVLDDHGHGTMTASRVAAAVDGVARSLGADVDVRIVMIEGLGAKGVAWAAERSHWIDVQSNSWGSVVPLGAGTASVLREAAEEHVVLFASGNGLALGRGWAPMPTQISTTGAPGVLLVGAHDNGRVSHWSEAPAHIVADGYGGWTGTHDSFEVAPLPIACCTSAAAPYAAGGVAAVLGAARALLGDASTGVRAGGVVAAGIAPTVSSTSPIADGVLTMDELKRLVLATAEARPGEGRDDGLLHFTGGPHAPERLVEHGPGENPFCEGCWTLPVPWALVPAAVPAYASIGYGAVNERSVARAARVLAGDEPAPDRAGEDAFFALDDAARRAIYGR